jgi:hypothetical protein
LPLALPGIIDREPACCKCHHGPGIARRASVCFWHIATFGCIAKIGRYLGKADIKKVPPKDLDL